MHIPLKFVLRSLITGGLGPPEGRKLNLPLSDAMQTLYQAPNDKAFE